uniref:Uncharacterized protein n=1 Tax=Lotus japonicus TaxID=34305 RepID=I3SJF3_LOTJA|nr:unknown [Lotus japonicus]
MDLVGWELLFKAEKAADHGVRFDDSFRVKKYVIILASLEHLRTRPMFRLHRSLILSNDGDMSDLNCESSANLYEMSPHVPSLDDISPHERSAVFSSIGSINSGETISSSRTSKRLKIRSVKLDR